MNTTEDLLEKVRLLSETLHSKGAELEVKQCQPGADYWNGQEDAFTIAAEMVQELYCEFYNPLTQSKPKSFHPNLDPPAEPVGLSMPKG